MEKNNRVWNHNSFKDHNFIGSRSTTDDRDNIGDLVNGFVWPPRCYTCAFCNREFRSAQALGGHMNVHRRERARLRQMMSSSPNFSSNYSSLFKLNLHQNPNSNHNFSRHFSINLSPATTILSPSLGTFSSPSSLQQENLTMMKSHVPSFGFHKFHGFPCENEGKNAKNSEIGLLGESKSDDLDLELRLGCS